MRNSLIFLPALAACYFSLNSCATLGRSAKAIGDGVQSKLEKPEEKQQEGSLAKLRDQPARLNSPAQLYDESEIIWANEDPDAPMEELETLWESGPKDNWFQSHDEAMKEARKLGKPVLLWFTDSKSSLATQHLSNELFSTNKFESWAKDHVVRLRVDSNVQDSDSGMRARKRDYVRTLKKRYKALGTPVVLILSPRGSVFGKYNGFKTGNSGYYFGRLRNAYRNAVVDYGQWREELEKKGYRVWHDHRGRKVFAKPAALRGSKLLLVDPDGKRSVTSLNRLSVEDRAWVIEQQEKKRSGR